MFAHAGTARLDIFTDSLLLEVGEDLFLARLLPALTLDARQDGILPPLAALPRHRGGTSAMWSRGSGSGGRNLARRSSSSSEYDLLDPYRGAPRGAARRPV